MDRKLLIILVLLLVGSITLSLAAYFFGVFRFDLKVAFTLMGEHNPVVSAIMAAVSFLGDGWVPLIMVLVVAAVCAVKKKWVEAMFVVATLLSSAIISGVLKMLVGRPRPHGFSLNPNDIFQSVNQYSYPSGHVLFFVTFFGFVGFLAWKDLTGWKRWMTISICAVLIVLIGPSRIYLGEHWLSDVIGSYILGTFWLIILILLYQLVLYRSTKMLETEPTPTEVAR
jgi:membrane-associated phospholipid phosphatase